MPRSRVRLFGILWLVALLMSTPLVRGEDKMDTGTALRAAVAKNDAETVTRLIRSEPSLRGATFDAGRSPLHLAASHDAKAVAEALLAAGADFYARDANGQLALDLPPGEQMNDTRRWLRERNRGRNEFLSAVNDQSVDRVVEMLKQDPSLAHARDIGDGWSAVMSACHFGNEPLLRALLAASAGTTATDFNSGHDAVYVCAEKGRAGCLRLLVDAGVDVRATWRVNYGRLPMQMNALHVASWKGHDSVVEILLAAKLDPNARAASYAVFSPLHLAATDGHAAVCRRLLAAGADPTARDGRRGITALEMAEQAKHDAVVAVLHERQ